MSLKHGLLGLLNYGSMTGYELDKAFKDSLSFFWQAQTSQIYRELNAMENCGWLRSERVIQGDKPNKRLYSVTPEGKEALAEWLFEPEADVADAMTVRNAFLMRVFFAGETGDARALALLRSFRDKSIETAAELNSAFGAVDAYSGAVNYDERRTKYWRLSVMYGESFCRAGLEWAEKAIAILEGAE
jgi:DNA-binding PadR family transcriptional regulator